MTNNQDFNQFDDLINELQRSDERPFPPRAFKNQLRSNLLNQYEQSGFSLNSLGRLAGTAVAFTVLALVVFFSWSSLSRQPATISAQMGTVDVPGRDEFIVYDQLRLEFPMWVELDAGWAEMIAESWQSLDGAFFRGELVDAEGRQRVFAQGDGQFLWRGTYDSSVEQMETVSLQYFDVYHALAQAEGWAGIRTSPPFYGDVGWGGLVQSVVRLDWQCSGSDCVEKYLVEPPLGVNSRAGVYEPYSFAVSEIGEETTANGRSLTTYRIAYTPNQNGVVSSQYRLVKLDSNSHTVVELADYDGETLLRRLERVSHQLMTSADLPEDQLTQLPAEMGVSFVLPEGRITTGTPLLAEPDGAAEATLAEGTPVTLSGLMNNQLSVVQNGITWQYVTVPGVGQGWVNEASLHWPLTSDGQLVDLDTGELPTAVPVQTQLTILRTYQTELEALLPQTTGDELARLQQALVDIEAEIARLDQQEAAAALSSFQDGPLLTRHELSATQVNPGDRLNVTLFWEGEIAPDSYAALYLTDAYNLLVSQTDQPLTAEMTLSLFIPDLADGLYQLTLIRYDATGVRQDGFLLEEIGVRTAVSTPTHAPNDVWLISATQQARQSADDPITLEITVGYQFAADEEVILIPLWANPTWASVTNPNERVPIEPLGSEIILAEKTGTQTITYSASPAEMHPILSTDQPVLVMQLGYFSEDENGRTRLNILAMPTFTEFAIDLTSTEEISYP